MVYRMMKLGCVFCLAAALNPAVGETVIYDQGNYVDGPYGAIGSDLDTANQQVAADDFQLEANGNIITDIHWWGVYGSLGNAPDVDDFTVSFFTMEDAVGAPETTAFWSQNFGHVSRSDTNVNYVGGGQDIDIFEYSVDLADALVLDADTTYYISIYNDSTDTNDFWCWLSSETEGGSFWSREGLGLTSDWTERPFGVNEYTGNLAFQLTGPVVPEPATLSLLGLGFGGILIGRLKRKR